MTTTDSTAIAGRAAPVGPPPAPIEALVRHFTDLREGTHAGHPDRPSKQRAFTEAAGLLDAPARQALAEYDTHLLLGSGTIQATGLRRDQHGGSYAAWRLTWPEQRTAGISPLTLHAHYGAGFHHPHLRGATVAEWPLNVFTPDQAAELLPTFRAIVAADLHNLVFQRDWRIVPALRNGTHSHDHAPRPDRNHERGTATMITDPALVPDAPIRLSVLDQSPIGEAQTPAHALRATLTPARHTETLGYHRYWLAEHHNSPLTRG